MEATELVRSGRVRISYTKPDTITGSRIEINTSAAFQDALNTLYRALPPARHSEEKRFLEINVDKNLDINNRSKDIPMLSNTPLVAPIAPMVPRSEEDTPGSPNLNRKPPEREEATGPNNQQANKRRRLQTPPIGDPCWLSKTVELYYDRLDEAQEDETRCMTP